MYVCQLLAANEVMSDIINLCLKFKCHLTMQVIRVLQLVLIGFPCFQAFKKSKEVMERFIRAYQLMLRFYGIILTNQETGELERAENWAERFQNLNR